jgi:hypothetical protein
MLAHRVVVHEQVVGVGFVVEIRSERTHLSFDVVALIDDVAGEVLFAVPFSAEGFLEVCEILAEIDEVIDGFRAM